jgi:aspartate racemase
MVRHIGIAAVSPEGASLFYRYISRQASRVLAPHAHPRVTIHNEPLALYIDALNQNDWHRVGRLLRRSADVLASCGAQFAISPDNVVQHAIQLAEVGSPIPWLTMPELLALRVAGDGRKTLGVIGTKKIMTSSTYQMHLGMRGVSVLAPDEHDAETIDQIIFGELIYGYGRPESRDFVSGVIQKLAARGCEGVILACSEAPIIITPQSSCLPIYDPAEILAEASIRKINEQPT